MHIEVLLPTKTRIGKICRRIVCLNRGSTGRITIMPNAGYRVQVHRNNVMGGCSFVPRVARDSARINGGEFEVITEGIRVKPSEKQNGHVGGPLISVKVCTVFGMNPSRVPPLDPNLPYHREMKFLQIANLSRENAVVCVSDPGNEVIFP